MRDPFKKVKNELAKNKSLIYFDIETSPMTAYVWNLGKNYIQHTQIITERKIISIQWMFEGDKKTSHLTWDKNHNDAKMLETFSKIMQNVRVAISQNGKEFDHKILRWRLNVLNLTPLRNVEIYDTLMLSRHSFGAESHKLDYRSKRYGFGGKIKVDLQDWINVIENKKGALNKLVTYGCKDIPDLRNIFWKELAYYSNLPNSLSTLLYPNEKKSRDFCPICASKRQRKFDTYPTKIGNKAMMKCNNCGNLWKETRLIKEKE